MKFLLIPSLLLTTLTLAACGFQPMYGNHSVSGHNSPRTALNKIDIEIIPNREGQFLRNALIDRFYSGGYPANAEYILNIKAIQERIFDFDVTIEDEATRRQIELSSSFHLTNKKTGKAVLTRSLKATTSYNVLESEYSTIVTEQSAREAALDDLARKIERDIVLYLNRN